MKEGQSFGGLLVLLFLIMFTAKIFGCTAISWWWVTLPLWVVPTTVLIAFSVSEVFLSIYRFFKRYE